MLGSLGNVLANGLKKKNESILIDLIITKRIFIFEKQ